MKKAFYITLFSFICFLFCFVGKTPQSNLTSAIDMSGSQMLSYSSIAGSVVFADTYDPVNNGLVKAVRLNPMTDQIETIDSARIQNGYYVLRHIRLDSIFIMAYPDDEDSPIIVPTYYPSSIHWMYATRIYTLTNLVNINIAAYRSAEIRGSGIVGGAVYETVIPNSPGIKDVIIYVKQQNNYRKFSVTESDGFYVIDSLPVGEYLLTADRIGYYSISRIINFQAQYLDTINFYLESILKVRPPGTPVPISHKLAQNYPNPFNPVTSISFDIPVTERVKIVIYDMTGKEVLTLLNQNINPGTYKVNWDASSYSAGAYLYKITAGTYNETKKMVLVK